MPTILDELIELRNNLDKIIERYKNFIEKIEKISIQTNEKLSIIEKINREMENKLNSM